MREIQDLTLNLSRGLERLERQLETRSKHFEKEFELSQVCLTMRIWYSSATAAP